MALQNKERIKGFITLKEYPLHYVILPSKFKQYFLYL